MSAWTGPPLPTGTLTFLFTDVEGSTGLWETHPQAMRWVMARHDALLTGVFEQHDGVVVRPRGEGDSLFAVFVRASDAVAAALAGQRALAAEDWGEVGPLRVRMGLHTGEADLREGNYYGSAVNRCARIRAAGHGGQILLSEATAKLVRGALPDGAGLLDLGRHRLKDLAEPELLYQLTAPDLAGAFPALKTLDARPHNLPLQLTSFIGREREVAALLALLRDARLLTLTGPGGTGKTRLALQVAAESADAFADGVFFVDLAPLADPALVPSAIAQALGIQEQPGVPLRETLAFRLRDRLLLLLLDNYEHLLAAAEVVAFLLQAAGVTLLVTSRAPLRVPGEREYPVPPLPLPQDALPAAAGAANPAVQLFVQRAQAVRPDFGLSDESIPIVAAICQQLDGLPLAIELAAARVRVLPPAALLSRLTQRLTLLTGGARTAPLRQQTLRDTIAWSHALLDGAEQRLFRRLAVFAGGCTLELAEAVCNADGDLGLDVLDGVSSLVEKSLLRQVTGVDSEPRYLMLETIREFALEQLEASGEAEAVRRQLATQMLALARHAAPAGNWARLDIELDNARAVLGWCVAQAELAIGVRLLWALKSYLFFRGGLREKEGWRCGLLALSEASQPSIARARLLAQVSFEDRSSTLDRDCAAAELEEAIGLSRELGDTPCLARALQQLALLRLEQGRYDAVALLAEEALALHLDAGVARAAFIVRGFLVHIALERGDLAAAAALVAASQALARTAGTTATLLAQEARLAEARGDDAQARVLWEEFVRREGAEAGETSPNRLGGLAFLAGVVLRQGDTVAAVAHCAESLGVHRRMGPSSGLSPGLQVLAQAAERCGLLTQSVRLLAAMDVPHVPAEHQAAVERARAALDEAEFAEAWEAGEALSADAAIEYGLAVVEQLQELLATTPSGADEAVARAGD